MGCMRTIKTLERENQAKTDKITSLSLELDKKSKLIETLQADKANFAQHSQRTQVQQTISANQKRKERELEGRLKHQEQMISDQKKQITRYAELNKSLIDKIKDLEGQMLAVQPPIAPPGGASAEEVAKIRKDLDKARVEAKQARNQERLKCEYLERECQ
jgi:uncharacterized coiled-coil protein SlyX